MQLLHVWHFIHFFSFVLGEFFHHLVTKTKSSATHTKDLGRKISLMLPDSEEKVSEIVIFRQ
jgi:hypothetical protein